MDIVKKGFFLDGVEICFKFVYNEKVSFLLYEFSDDYKYNIYDVLDVVLFFKVE